MYKRKRISGFTLVELLVVIAIIALLMSILMPALRRVKMQAQEVSCRSNCKQIGLIIYMYLQEYDFYMPHFYTFSYTGYPSSSRINGYLWRLRGVDTGPIPDPMDFPTNQGERGYWGTAFREFVKDTDVFGCPAFKNALEMMEFEKLYGTDVKEAYDSAFAMNGYLDWANVNSIRSQGEVIVISDHVEPRIENSNAGNNDAFCPGQPDAPLAHYVTGSRSTWYRGILRHSIRLNEDFKTGGRANVLYLDNHVDIVEERDIFANPRGVPDRAYDPLDDGNGLF